MPSYVIETSGLTKRFGDVVAVDGVSLKIGKGEFWGLMGLNGAGKSTLLNILTGQLKPDKGSAKVLGLSPMTQPIEVKRKIGIVPEIESPPSFLTPKEYLHYVGLVRDIPDIEKKAEHWLDYLDLREYQDQLGKNLSKGTKQRLMLAAAFIHEPKVLLLDEPFIGLDPYHQDIVTKHLRGFIKKGGTVFICTHILEIAEKICTNVSIISKGRIIVSGTLKELKSENETLREAFLRHTGRAAEE